MGGYTGSLYSPVRNQYVYELILAHVYIGAGTSFYTQSNITDTRSNTDLCGIYTTPTGTLQNQIDAIKTTLNSCIKVSATGTTYQIANRKTYTELDLYKNNISDEVATNIFKVYMPNNSRLYLDLDLTVATRNLNNEGQVLVRNLKATALTNNTGTVTTNVGVSVISSEAKTSGVSSLSITASVVADSVNKYAIFAITPNQETQDASVDIELRARITYLVEGVIQAAGITVI